MADYQFDYIPITSAECPVSKYLALNNVIYIFDFSYNAYSDTVSVVIKDADENILYSSRLTYGANIINAVVKDLDLFYIFVPVNLDDLFTELQIDDSVVNAANLGDTVQLYYNGRTV
jgi:hypothetical protein